MWIKIEGWSGEPYRSEWGVTTEITLITSVVTPHSLNLAETYPPVGSYPDKSDNPHLNGDYHKILACSHLLNIIHWWKVREQPSLFVVPPRYVTIKNKKQASLLGKRCLLLLSFFQLMFNDANLRMFFHFVKRIRKKNGILWSLSWFLWCLWEDSLGNRFFLVRLEWKSKIFM